jgi:hypothetical protein
MGRAYTKEELISIVRTAHERGEDIRPRALRKLIPDYFNVRRRLFGPDPLAVYRAALLDPKVYSDFPVDLHDRRSNHPRGYWTPEKTKIRLQERLASGKEVSARALRVDDPSLYTACSRNFGGLYPALESIGRHPERYRLRVPDGYWYEGLGERIKEKIRSLATNQEEVSARAVYLRHGDIYTAGVKKFGSWDEALRAAGFDPKTVRKTPPKRSREEVLDNLRRLQSQGRSLAYSSIAQHDTALMAAIERRFGGYKNAVEAIGLDYDSLRKQHKPYTKEELLGALRELHAQGRSLAFSSVREFDAGLADAIITRFGDYRHAIEALGFDYQSIRKRRDSYAENELLDALSNLKQQGMSLASSELREFDPKLAAAVVNKFGSYRRAIESLGLNYDDVRKDVLSESFRGRQFEDSVAEVLRILNRKVVRKPRIEVNGKTLIPDFVDVTDGTWLDAKLRSLTPPVVRTIRKYLQGTRRVVIVYLHDSKTKPKYLKRWLAHDFGSVSFVPVSKFYPELKNLGGEQVVERIELLRRGVARRPELQTKL